MDKMTVELVREGRNRYILRRQGKMLVEGIVYVNRHLLPLVKGDRSLHGFVCIDRRRKSRRVILFGQPRRRPDACPVRPQ